LLRDRTPPDRSWGIKPELPFLRSRGKQLPTEKAGISCAVRTDKALLSVTSS